MKKNIAVIKGDGIGPEIVNQALKVLDAIGIKYDHQFVLSEVEMGACAIHKYGEPITEKGLAKCHESDAILMGSIGDPSFDNNPDAKVRPEQGLLKLRKELNLHTNIRPTPIFKEIMDASPLKKEALEHVDFVIFRELVGGIYFGTKKTSEDGLSASDLCSYSTEQIEPIAHLAFKEAIKRKGKLTLVDKANVLETSRLWRRTIQTIAVKYPEVEVDYLFVDNCAMQIIQNPQQFDVILTENMFGDILSDLASVITGSIGMLPSASIGTGTGLFEPIHGSFPQGAGKDIANPKATILALAMMFDYLDMKTEAREVRNAVTWALENSVVTKDIAEDSLFGCNAIGDLISEYILENGAVNVNFDNVRMAENSII